MTNQTPERDRLNQALGLLENFWEMALAGDFKLHECRTKLSPMVVTTAACPISSAQFREAFPKSPRFHPFNGERSATEALAISAPRESGDQLEGFASFWALIRI